jgi:Lrp/AsnC family transcriptional regulator
MTRNIIDSTDRKILAALQRDSTITLDQISDSVGLTATGCWRRVKRLEEEGIIDRRVTLLDPARLGLTLLGYVMIRTRDHSQAWLQQFAALVLDLPAVVEFHRTTGSIDYLLKIVARDLPAYNQIYCTISQLPDIVEVSAAFSMEAIKATTEIPLAP